MTKYHTIYADPPWSETGGGRIRRGADRHYALMKTSEILQMASAVRALAAENCHLYLWVTNNFLRDGFKVMEQWGFEYKTMITWLKDRFGLGQYYRGMTEHCLFGVRGVLPYKVADGKRQQGVTGFVAPRAEHSAKPEEMRAMIEKVSYPPYIELFAREPREGWDVWGNEVTSNVILPAITQCETHRTEDRFGGDKAEALRPTASPHENPPAHAEPGRIVFRQVGKNTWNHAI